MATDHNIRQLIINKVPTKAQYDQMVKNADELYLTPDDSNGLPDQTGQSGKFLKTNGTNASWDNVPAGTVTSVRVQAGTGLSSSQSTAQNSTLNTTISIASGYKLPTTTEWNNKQDALPSQSGQSGKFLTTDGSSMSWADASVEIDNSTITKNTNNEVQTVGVKDLRTDNTIKTWTGTKDQYDALSSSSSWSTATQNNNLHYSQDTDWRSIAYGDNKFVALSATGYISTSTDGSNWTTAVQVSNLSDIIGVSNFWSFLFYDGTKFIALGGNGNISTSTDGTTWTTATIVSNLGSHYWKSIAYNGNIYVALGSKGYISTSTNGTTWTAAAQISNLGDYRWYGIAYDGTKFLAVSDYAYVSTSTDGTTWTAATRNSGLNEMMGPIDMIFDGNKFCILGIYGDTITSVDGTNWSEVDYSALDNNRSWYSVAFDGSKYVAIDMYSYISIKDTGINSNTLYNIKDYGLYLGSTEVANVSSGGDSLPDQTGQSGKFLTTNGSTVSWGNAGTVTSVRVQAGTGLTSSTSTAQNTTLNTTISIASGYKLPTTTEWSNKQDALPTQSGNSGKFLTTNGSTLSWGSLTANNVTTALGYTPYNSTNPNGYTSNTGTVRSVRVQAGTGLSSSTSTAQNTTLSTTISIASGYKLPTTTEWSGKQDVLPSQSGNSGKFLTTNGSTLSWGSVDALPDQTGNNGKILTTNGTSASWKDEKDAVIWRQW